MKNFTTILKVMFAAFFILQIIFYTQLYAGNPKPVNPFQKTIEHFDSGISPESNQKFALAIIKSFQKKA
jgi:hypothetical protein